MNISGFNNIGNSCYFNSALQISRLVFYKLLEDQNIAEKINDKTSPLHLINNVLINGTNYEQLYDYVITKLKYNRYSQEDSVEAYITILDEINNVITNKSQICTAFNQLIRCTVCNEFNICDEQKDPIIISNTLIKTNKVSSFSYFLGDGLSKQAISSSKFKCQCMSSLDLNLDDNMVIQMVLTDMPKFLSIKANRCYPGTYFKNQTSLNIVNDFKITTPENLRDRCLGINKLDISHKYKLSGIIMHHGMSINGGHYTAYVKVNNTWYHCNDSSVTKEENFNLSDSQIKNNCCLLLYEKE